MPQQPNTTPPRHMEQGLECYEAGECEDMRISSDTKANNEAFEAIGEKGNTVKVEKLVAILIRPSVNDMAELWKHFWLGAASLMVFVFLACEAFSK